jgi:hypothetical protein
MLCLSLAMMAGVEKTVDTPILIHTNIDRVRSKVAEHLHYKYRHVVSRFTMFDGPDTLLCIELLLGLAKTTDGVYQLDDLAEKRPDLRNAIERVFVTGLPDGLTETHQEIAQYLFYDPRGRRLVADDPQFVFYLRQLTLESLLDLSGKRLPVPRDRIFICYSHKDADWKERVCVHLRPRERDGTIDVWSDTRIGAGDQWRKEIATALDRARIAILLINADFFASDFIHADELPALLSAAQNGGCRVIPVLVSPSMFHDNPELECFQSVPSHSTLTEMPRENAERILVELARSVAD